MFLLFPLLSLSQVLTNSNFDSSISQGTFLIEAFSPTCSHCQEFAPTWHELEQETKLPGLSLAQINCKEQIVLCERIGIEGIPSLRFFHDGKMLNEFSGPTEKNQVVDFIQQNYKKIVDVRERKRMELLDLFEKEADFERVTGGDVVDLSEENFERMSKRSVIFVDFYAPWCGHCQKLEPVWIELAEKMSGSLRVGKVDATKETSLAGNVGVRSYPTLKLFVKGKAFDYLGGRDLDELMAFGKKAARFPVHVVNREHYAQIAKEELAFLYVVSDRKNQVRDIFKHSIDHYLNAQFYVTDDIALLSRLNLLKETVLAVIKSTGDKPYVRAFKKGTQEQFILHESVPLAVEMSGQNAPKVFIADWVIIGLWGSGNFGGWKKGLVQLGLRLVDDQTVNVAWLDAKRYESYVETSLGLNPKDTPNVVIYSVKHDYLYFTQAKGEAVDVENVLHVLEQAKSGKLHGKSTISTVKRVVKLIGTQFYADPFLSIVSIIILIGVLAVFYWIYVRRKHIALAVNSPMNVFREIPQDKED